MHCKMAFIYCYKSDKIMDEEIQCNNCGWTGDSTMLVSKTDKIEDRDFICCPDCGSDDIEDFE